MADSNTYISISHAASLANVSKETIRNLCKRGAIGYEMHANFVYPCKEDVERYAESIATVHARMLYTSSTSSPPPTPHQPLPSTPPPTL